MYEQATPPLYELAKTECMPVMCDMTRLGATELDGFIVHDD
jgi:hypothetical protein